VEGAQVWDLFLRLVGQMRIVAAGEQVRVLGLDIGAAFTVGAALGVNAFALAEFFPAMEAALVRRMNEQLNGGGETAMLGMVSDG
jgi:hypothetical protein